MEKESNLTQVLLCLFLLTGLLFSCSNKKVGTAKRGEICESIDTIELYIKGNEINTLRLEHHASLLQNATKIKCEYDGSTLGIMTPSVETFNNWKKWIESSGIKCE